jgi:two-component system, cell cycle sensor histidine kinase and response regulator CckA
VGGIPVASARVLIVDDEPLLLEAYARTLRRNGYDVLPVSRPSQALEIVRSHRRIDVVLSDVMMPEMCGPDLVREVGYLSPETACILITGAVAGSLERPPDVPLLRKPFSQRDVIVAVEEAIARSARLRAKAAQVQGKRRRIAAVVFSRITLH